MSSFKYHQLEPGKCCYRKSLKNKLFTATMGFLSFSLWEDVWPVNTRYFSTQLFFFPTQVHSFWSSETSDNWQAHFTFASFLATKIVFANQRETQSQFFCYKYVSSLRTSLCLENPGSGATDSQAASPQKSHHFFAMLISLSRKTSPVCLCVCINVLRSSTYRVRENNGDSKKKPLTLGSHKTIL